VEIVSAAMRLPLTKIAPEKAASAAVGVMIQRSGAKIPAIDTGRLVRVG
jgi:hypothetical protein